MRQIKQIKQVFEQCRRQGIFRDDAIRFIAEQFGMDWLTVCSILKG